jgi:hypothetical protein
VKTLLAVTLLFALAGRSNAICTATDPGGCSYNWESLDWSRDQRLDIASRQQCCPGCYSTVTLHKEPGAAGLHYLIYAAWTADHHVQWVSWLDPDDEVGKQAAIVRALWCLP